VSFGLHAALLAALLLRFQYEPPAADVPDKLATVELVFHPAGAPAPKASEAPAPPAAGTAPQPEPQPEQPQPHPQPTPPPPDAATAQESLPIPPVPQPTAPLSPPQVTEAPAVPPQQEAPQIHIGDGEGETDVQTFSPQIIPANVDGRFRNRKPDYPADAVRRAEQGTVVLLIHIAATGQTVGVDIAETSGYILLDRAAHDAVTGWHFMPAMQHDKPIPFDMTLAVTFHLD
jgi:protein TonB